VNSRPQADIARILLIIVILSLLIFGSLYIVRPFLPALIWAAMIVIATWPVMIGIEKHVGGHRWIAVTVMLVGLLVVFVLPLYGAVSTIAEHGGDITDQAEALPDYTLPRPPRWLHEVPLAGERSAREWQRLTRSTASGVNPCSCAHVLNVPRAPCALNSRSSLNPARISAALIVVGDMGRDLSLTFGNR
jgi:predicted PurR-regulated permease PerM